MSPTISSQELPPSISFSGSGFLATYQLGVSQGLLNHAPWLLRMAPFVLGSSAGSLVAAAVVCKMSLVDIRDELLSFADQMMKFTLGPLNPSINIFHWLECLLWKHLPRDAHLLANGRLAVATTRMPDRKYTIMSEFQSKEDVIQALLCSCFVPGYCGVLPPIFKGVHYMDGGFSSMQPIPSHHRSHTLTVSPFSGEVDICPREPAAVCNMVVSGSSLNLNMANSFRIINALYPISLETLEKAYHNGYKDAIHFLRNSDHAYLAMRKAHLESTLEEERVEKGKEEEKMEEGDGTKEEANKLPSVIDDRSIQRHSSPENEPTQKLSATEQAIYSAPLCNLRSREGMFGFPMRVISYLLQPLTLPICFILQNKSKMELWCSQALALLFWAWLGLKQMNIFLIKVLFASIRKNTEDRVMPVVLLLRWLYVKAEYKGPEKSPQGRWYYRLYRHFSSSSPTQSQSS